MSPPDALGELSLMNDLFFFILRLDRSISYLIPSHFPVRVGTHPPGFVGHTNALTRKGAVILLPSLNSAYMCSPFGTE